MQIQIPNGQNIKIKTPQSEVLPDGYISNDLASIIYSKLFMRMIRSCHLFLKAMVPAYSCKRDVTILINAQSPEPGCRCHKSNFVQAPTNTLGNANIVRLYSVCSSTTVACVAPRASRINKMSVDLQRMCQVAIGLCRRCMLHILHNRLLVARVVLSGKE